jgi:hypothetical protein
MLAPGYGEIAVACLFVSQVELRAFISMPGTINCFDATAGAEVINLSKSYGYSTDYELTIINKKYVATNRHSLHFPIENTMPLSLNTLLLAIGIFPDEILENK